MWPQRRYDEEPGSGMHGVRLVERTEFDAKKEKKLKPRGLKDIWAALESYHAMFRASVNSHTIQLEPELNGPYNVPKIAHAEVWSRK